MANANLTFKVPRLSKFYINIGYMTNAWLNRHKAVRLKFSISQKDATILLGGREARQSDSTFCLLEK